MRVVVTLGVVSAFFAWIALFFGGASHILWWPVISSAVVCAGYVWLGPSVLGKKSDGSRALWATVLHAPFLILNRAFFLFYTNTFAEPRESKINEWLWIGGLPGSAVPEGCASVVDLTAEFVAPRSVRGKAMFKCIPMLDALPPGENDLKRCLESVQASPKPVLVHCAYGHGRSGLVCAFALVVSREAETLKEAYEQIRKARPSVKPTGSQRGWIAEHAQTFLEQISD